MTSDKQKNDRDLAMARIIPTLHKMKRGDSLSPAQIRHLSGVDYYVLVVAIRRYFLSRGIVVRFFAGNLFVLTGEQQITGAIMRVRRAHNAVDRCIAEIVAADPRGETLVMSARLTELSRSMARSYSSACRTASRDFECEIRTPARPKLDLGTREGRMAAFGINPKHARDWTF